MTKKHITLILILAALINVPQVFAQGKNEKTEAKSAKSMDVTIFDDVLATAEFMKFDYKGTVARSKNGDMSAIVELFNFSRVVDGKEGRNHAVTCLELIPFSDGKAAEAFREIRKDNLKKLVKERLIEAQSNTTKPELKKNMAEWAPHTWAALHNRFVENPAEIKAKAEGKAQRGKDSKGTTLDAPQGKQ